MPNDEAASSINVIDPHVHVFDFDNGQYEWMNSLQEAERSAIRSSSSIIEHLQRGEISNSLEQGVNLSGFVHIEAGFNNQQPTLELAAVENLLAIKNGRGAPVGGFSTSDITPLEPHASRTDTNFSPTRSIGSVTLTDAKEVFAKSVDKQLSFSTCVGFRHIIDDNALAVLQHQNARTNLEYLAKHNALLELQLSLDESAAVQTLIALLADMPELTVVINHAGKPPVDKNVAESTLSSEYQLWQANTKALGQLAKVYVKCSGLELVNRDYSKQELKLIVMHLLSCFGDDRLMFASNYPLVLFAASYQEYWQSIITLLTECQLDINKLCYANAHRIYKMGEAAKSAD